MSRQWTARKTARRSQSRHWGAALSMAVALSATLGGSTARAADGL